MLFRILFFTAGLLIIISGIDVIRNKSFHYFGYNIDLSNSSLSIGILIACFGAAVIYLAFREKFTFVKSEIYFKCTQCGKVYDAEGELNKSCTDCDGELDDLEGFFDRHPEFKTQKQKKHNKTDSPDRENLRDLS